MLKAVEIKESVFAKSMSGYKQDEVDALLDKVYEDYLQFETVSATLQTRISALEKELAEKDTSMNSINTVLISAQKLADSIVADAKKQAEETVENANTEAENIKLRTKKALEEIDAVLTEQKNKAQEEVDLMLAEAARKSEGMILAAKDSVTREQLLFDKLKSEVADFKKHIKDTYKAHLESLSKLPDEVTLNPELAASTIEEIINNEPDLLRFIEKTPLEVVKVEEEPSLPEEEPEAVEAPEQEEALTAEEPATEAPSGFVIQVEEDEDAEPSFANSFFGKKM